MKDLQTILKDKYGSPDELWAAYDQLESVSTEFMLGAWKGEEIASGHPWDGLLTTVGWYGKVFISEEAVHPLIFSNDNHTRFFAVDPQFMPLALPAGFLRLCAPLARYFTFLVKTQTPAATLQMIEHRGKKRPLWFIVRSRFRIVFDGLMRAESWV